MNAVDSDPKAIFFAALDQPSSAERLRYLDEACGENRQLRARVEQLLAAHDEAGQFLGGVGATINTPLPERPGTQIGSYKLLQQIGEGGMGIVYMAEQTEPVHRRVALKIIKPGMDTRQVIARFEAERQALAMMDHANIARVLDAGATQNGRPYFVMELVHGVPITQYCDDHRLTPRQRLELFVPVCQAIQHAHQKGIIHRDIKPTNVMVTLYDGRPVPKVIDFGVAKATEQKLTERTLFTQYGTMVGTLEYMSPEQAEMSALGVDTRSDIYSLGVLLYELLTGSTPLNKRAREAPFADILRMIKEEEPPKPSTRLSDSGQALATISAQRHIEPTQLAKLVRGELDWIVMKCLEKDRNRRYDTANGLADDVERYLRDETVLACPPSAMYQFRKFARRNMAALATASVVAIAVLLTVVGLSASILVTRGALEAATEAKAKMEGSLDRETSALKAKTKALEAETRARNDLRRDEYIHRIALGHQELSRDNNLRRTREQLQACPEELRQWEWHYLDRLCRFEPVVLRDTTAVHSVAFSPGSGEFLVSAGGDGTVKVWNSKTAAVVQTLLAAHTESVYSVAFHRDGRHLASVGADKQVKVWDWTTNGPPVFTRPCSADHNRGTAYTVAFSPDGRLLAVGNAGALNVWDWQQEKLEFATPPVHADKGVCVAFSQSGRLLASGSWSGHVRIWNVETGKLLHTLFEHRHPVSSLAFSPDSRRLVSAGFDGRLNVWDALHGQRLRTSIAVYDGLVLGVAFNRDGSRLATVGEDKSVRVWEAATGREVLDLRGHTELSKCAAFSPDGQRLVSASVDKTIRVWDATQRADLEGQETPTLQHDNEIWSVAVSPDGNRIATAGRNLDVNSTVTVWDVASRQKRFEYDGHQAIVFCVAWHPDGQRLASSGWDAARKKFVVKVWNVQSGNLDFELADNMETCALAFSPPDGEYLVTGGSSRVLQIWNARTGDLIGTLGSREQEHIRGVMFSKDGRHLASASSEGVLKLWDAKRLGDKDMQQAGRVLTTSARVPLAAMALAFSPDGERLAAGGREEHREDLARADRRVAANPRGTQRGRLAHGLQPQPRWPVDRLGG